MKIVKATDYGFRKIIRVLLNPDDPQFLHRDGSPHPPENTEGCPLERNLVTGQEIVGKPGCYLNWKVREFVFDDPKLTWEQCMDKVKAELVPPTKEENLDLLGTSL